MQVHGSDDYISAQAQILLPHSHCDISHVAYTQPRNVLTTLFMRNSWCACMQVLVYHDLLGMMQHPHHAKVTPKFAKQYASVGTVIQSALQSYREDVSNKAFPGQQFSPYKLGQSHLDALAEQLHKAGLQKGAEAVAAAHHEQQQWLGKQAGKPS